MSQFRFSISMSLDGYIAGPEQSVQNPLGIGGEKLHEWALSLKSWREQHGMQGGEVNASSQVATEHLANVGAVVMGRNMFGGHPGTWRDWNGWWGDNPPFHCPVFVVTHHARAPLTLQGGTTFHFVTDGIESALAQAKRVAGDKDVSLGGGASVVQQYLAARLLDELNISLVPVLLGSGERLLANLGADLSLEQVRVIEAPGVTHLKYRMRK